MTTVRPDDQATAAFAGVDDPFLTGQYEPVRDERHDVDLVVRGELPAGLRGAYLRNGPNAFYPPPGRYHVFDGDGMLHGLYLDGEGGASLPQPLDRLPGPVARALRRPRRVRRPVRVHHAAPGGHGGRRAVQEHRQHQHRPPRRAPPGPHGGRAPHRGHRRAGDRRRVRLRRRAGRGHDGAPQVGPGHRRDAVLRLLARSRPTSATTSPTPPARWSAPPRCRSGGR